MLLGFLLVGAIVLARRHAVPPLALAIRRFIALLPVLRGVVLPWQPSLQGAAFAAGSGLLYGTIALVERSRLFGAAGTIAGNVALLLFALTQGLVGLEVYCVPLGLVCLLLVHLFLDDLSPEARTQLRLAGGALLYAPSAYAVAFQVGNAQSGYYPLLFGLACLVGVAFGMLLHIRAYLFFGVAFFTLDVVANLVRASLRDQRVGFVVLSGSGLAILGGMVYYTLRRDQLRALLRRYRAQLSRWE